MDNPPYRVNVDEHGFDELVLGGQEGLIHIERMRENAYWMGVSVGERRFTLWFTFENGQLTMVDQDENDLMPDWPDRDDLAGRRVGSSLPDFEGPPSPSAEPP